FFVLDEADRMLDMGFIHDVKKVIAKLPRDRQTLFFSATMPSEVVKLSQNILVDPVRVSVAPVSTTAEKVSQSVFYVDQKNKRFLLRHLLDTSAENFPSVLVFTRTKHGADKVVKDLVKLKITAQAIHGNKSQTARQTALANFKNRTTRVLVATDIAARGIDIDELTHVINYEIPNIPETYVHRIGRTGRAGNSGVAWSFVDREEVPYLRDIQKLIRMDIPVTAEHPFLPGTHVAEANDAKTFYNQPNFNEGKGSNRGGDRGGDRGASGQGGNRGGNRDSRNNHGGNRNGGQRDNHSNRERREADTQPQAPKSNEPRKPFTRFKPRD
ncbi:MAG: DEAD/DEAH box helicase, partial [Bacteroidetes bacterium]|nr:DEAD/DEAH box helicase [Bacteroidota bacterium]